MSVKNRRQFYDNPERERYSNFVVDLRSVNQATSSSPKRHPEKSLTRSKRLWAEQIAIGLNKFRLSVKKSRPIAAIKVAVDLADRAKRLKGLKISQGWQFMPSAKNIKRGFNAPWPIFNFKGWSFGFKQLKRPARLRSKRGVREILQHRQRMFQAALRFNPRARRAEERAARAETKATQYRSLFSFAIILLLIILPLKVLSYFKFFNLHELEARVMNQSQSALNNLLAAADSVSRLDFKNADARFQAAGADFLAAQTELGEINDALLFLASLSKDPKIKLATESKKFLTAGAVAASLGHNLAAATDSLFNDDQDDFQAKLDNFLIHGHAAVAEARKLEKTLANVNADNLPEAYRRQFESLRLQAVLLADNLDNFISAGDRLKEVFGLSRDKRYLLVFQNNAELRASGGFLGSYALVDLREGKIRNLEVPGGGSYDTEAGLNIRVTAPEPLWLVNPLWHFWDANWWPDWPTTAKNLMWFYAKSDGPSVDGVIGVTPTVVEQFLEITGPIDLQAEYGLTIDSENFWETVQKITEQKNLAQTNPEAVAGLPIGEENKPKKIIGDLLEKILEILPQKLDKDNLLKIIAIFEQNMSAKQILFYFSDPLLQSEALKRNWAGEIKETAKDYLLVVNTNIAGQKTDRVITEKIEQTSVVDVDGKIINTLVITRTHHGLKNEPLVGVRNVNWLRVYVPLGSQLLSADGFQSPEDKYLQEKPEAGWQDNPFLANERAAVNDVATGVKIYAENGKTVFADWVMVDPGETAVVTLRYSLPFNFFTADRAETWREKINVRLNPSAVRLQPYSLLVQKQPGAMASEFIGRLILPVDQNILWRYPENLVGERGWEISDRLAGDKYWSLLAGPSAALD
ncbi:TPA: hypothetical protein DCZ15_01125 [Candidatus Falkowbacteria bacterium]|nr:MAG: hypothetical protein UV95_C0003G0088 [Candidatus Falkowbacteria bacterium GW2011_GWF2_43_32]HBA36458.1 hypothetical protein [Candidatus Falkowbacteria bacterium]